MTDDEVKGFVAINFSECFKYTREKLYSKLNEEQTFRAVAKSLYVFLTTPDEVEKYFEIMQSNSSNNSIHRYDNEILNIFGPELQLSNTKPIIKNKLKQLLSDSKKIKVQTILVLNYKKTNDYKIFHSSAKLIASDSDIDEALESMHQSIMAKMEIYACKDWIDLDVIFKHSIKIFEC